MKPKEKAVPKETAKTVVCNICGKELSADEVEHFDEQILCSECLNSETLICEECGERFWRCDNCRTESQPLCGDCRDEDYTYCTRCDRLIHNDNAHYFSYNDDDAYCSTCFDEANCNAIHDYYYKPEPIFYGDGSRYFGVELEIDEGGEDEENAEEILCVANRNNDLIYCKHDGSLQEGFEIVTHPMSLNYHLETMPWNYVTEKATDMNYRSHATETCGLHIHINRSSLGKTVGEQESVIGRILYFMEKNWNELLCFSRRNQYQLDRWAARYGYKDNPKEMLEHAKKQQSARYTCLNLLNRDTVEFRIFRGTLKTNTIYATLQLVNEICDVAVFLSDEELKNLSWNQFVADLTHPELIQYLKERRLYCNEPVESEEEV